MLDYSSTVNMPLLEVQPSDTEQYLSVNEMFVPENI